MDKIELVFYVLRIVESTQKDWHVDQYIIEAGSSKAYRAASTVMIDDFFTTKLGAERVKEQIEHTLPVKVVIQRFVLSGPVDEAR